MSAVRDRVSSVPMGYHLAFQYVGMDVSYSFTRWVGPDHESWYATEAEALDAMWADVRRRATHTAARTVAPLPRRHSIAHAVGYAEGQQAAKSLVDAALARAGYSFPDLTPEGVVRHLLLLLNGRT